MTALLAAPSAPATTGFGPVRGFVARHPVAVMVTSMLGIANALLVPVARAGLPIEPFLLVAVVFAQLLPAVLVTAAVDGRAGVRDLFRRVFRWRVRPGAYALALLALPAGSIALTAVTFGPDTVTRVLTQPGALVSYLLALTILPIVNLWEETAVMGVIQDRLTARHGLVLGAVLTAPVFALQHLALHVTESPTQALVSMGALLALAVPFRIVSGHLYAYAGRSVLLVAMMHVTFNATNNNLLRGPGLSEWVTFTVWAVVALWALAVVVVRVRRRSRRA